MATRYPDRLAQFSAWQPTSLDCGECFNGLMRRNRITGALWCPTCDHEIPSRTAGPGVDPVPEPVLPPVPQPQADQPGASVRTDGQPSGCACHALGFELVLYPSKGSITPTVKALFADPRHAASCARALNLARPIGQQFPLFSSRGRSA